MTDPTWFSYEDEIRDMKRYRESIAVRFRLDPDDVLHRKGFSKPLAEELLRQSFEGRFNHLLMRLVAPNARLDLFDNHPFEGSYLGPNALSALDSAKADGRKAVWTFPEGCCWTALQLLRRPEGTTLISFQRSCDVWLGMPYDAYLLCGWAKRLKANRIIWFIGSLHWVEPQ